MANGMEVAQQNLSDTPIQDKTYSSEQLSPKSRIEGVGEITTNGSGIADAIVRHELPYPPVHLFFFKPGNINAVKFPGFAPWIDAEKSTTWGLMDNFQFTVTTDSLVCKVHIEGVANTKYTWKYFIFVEPAK